MFKGYIPTKGKTPLEEYKNRTDFYSLDYIRRSNKDYGGVLENDIVMIDIDNPEEAKTLYKIVSEENISCSILKTTRGMHFYFRNADIGSNKIKTKTPIGITADIKIGSKGVVVPLKINGEKRRWIKRLDSVDVLPDFLKPIKKTSDFAKLGEGDGRNQELFNYILILQSEGFGKDSIIQIIGIINKYILKEPLPHHEIETILRDEAFRKAVFYIKNKFQHHTFAKFLIEEEHVIKINNVLYSYKDGIYSEKNVESSMLKHIPEITNIQRKEVISYLELIADNKEQSPVNLIAVTNGALNIETMAIVEYSPGIIILNRIPHNYFSQAYDRTVDLTLNKICCNDLSLRLLLEEMVGYLLLRRNEIGKCFILSGCGSNGKSTFLDMLKRLVGESNFSSLALDELGQRFKTAELLGKLANIGDDISNRYIEDNAIFKKLVTGETLNVERKGKNPFDFNNYAKLLFSANEIPRINDTSEGLMRRLVIVPFNAVFTKKDDDFDVFIKDRLFTKSAIEYLLKLGIEGLKRVLSKGFTESDAVMDQLKDYETRNNPVVNFINQGIKVEHEPVNEVYLKYSAWCVENGLRPLSNIEFGRELSRKFNYKSKGIKINGINVRCYIQDGYG